jgi:ubiquitin-protein ligase
MFIGPAESPYKEQMFKAELIFPLDIPNSLPEIKFKSKIWHPNIDLNGKL